MNSTPSVKKNIILSTLYQVLTLLTPFITAPYVSRVLEPDGIGIYSFTNSILAYFTLLAGLGTVAYGAREIARVRDDQAKLSKTFWEIELMTALTSSVAILLWIGVIIFASKYNLIYLILTISLFGTMLDISWFFSGLEQFSYIVVRNTIVKIVCIALLFIFINSKDDLYLYIFLMTMANFLGTSSMWMYIPKMVDRVRWKELQIWPRLKDSAIFFLPSIAASIYTILDKTLIGLITQSEVQNGYYEQATKIVNMAKVLTFSALSSVLASRTSYLYAEKKYDEIKQKMARSLDFVLFSGMGLTFGIISVANRFVPWFYGPGYEPVILLLQVLSPIMIIIGISNIIGAQYYIAVGVKYQQRGAIFMFIGALVNFTLNMILIPRLQSLGAVIGSLVAETIISGLFLCYSDGYMKLYQIGKYGWRKLVAGLFMAVCMFSIGHVIANNTICVLTEVIVGTIVYCLVLTLLRDDFIAYLYNDLLVPKVLSRIRR